MGSLPEMVFLGYRAKRPWEPGPDWAPIERICCVGDQLCQPPDEWVERWDFNRACCYSTPDEAWATVVENHSAYRLFAYFLLPLNLTDGRPPTPATLDQIFSNPSPPLPIPSSVLDDLQEIGYDVAEYQFGFLGYAFSPLVTNGFAREFPTNRYGLLSDLDTAMRACEVINEQMPEHAPHWVFRVLAKDIDTPLPIEPATIQSQ